jgi:hypothetical protein
MLCRVRRQRQFQFVQPRVTTQNMAVDAVPYRCVLPMCHDSHTEYLVTTSATNVAALEREGKRSG